jgi:plastocyanin
MQRRFAPFIAAAALALTLSGCGSSAKKSDTTPTSPGGATISGTAAITISSSFTFAATPVKAGSTVTVKNDSSATHTVTADKGEFDTGSIDGGKTATFTAPSTPGSYSFHCNIHQSTMKGTLVVT